MNEHERIWKRQEDAKRQYEDVQDEEFRHRAFISEAKRLGLPSPRVRALTAGPIIAKRAADETDVRQVAVWHRVPSLDLSHQLTRSCFCGPTMSTEPDGTRWWQHNVNASWEKTDNSSVALTADLINRRER